MSEYIDLKSNALASEMKISSALKQRRIFLSNEITRESLFEVSYFLYKLQDIDKKVGTKEPIEIIINSYGGYNSDGNMLISQIEQMKDDGYEITNTVSGYAMSMAFAILVCGSKRQAYRHSRLMTHQPSYGNYGTLQQQQDDLEDTRLGWEKHKDIICKHTKISRDQLDYYKERNKDWSMWAEEALQLGIIDKIL